MSHRDVAGLGSRVVFELWLLAFIGFLGTTLLDLHPVVRIVAQLVFAVPVLAWVILRPPRDISAVEVAMLLALAAHLLVGAFSLDPLASLAATGIAATYAATYWVARDVDRRGRLRRAAVLAISVTGLFWLAIIAITWVGEQISEALVFGWPPSLEAHQPYVWGSVNTPPLLTLLLLPFLTWLPPGRVRARSLEIWAACAIVIVPLSVGRAAWAGIVVTLLALEVTFGFPATRRAIRVLGGGIPARAVLGAVGLLAVASVMFAVSRADLSTAVDGRLRLWQQAIGLFAADPLTGAGPTTFSWARLTHVPEFTDRVPARDAHSVPVQTLADGGIILAIAFAGIVVAWAVLLIRRRRRSDPHRRLAIAVLAGYAAASFLDDLSFLPAIMVLGITLAAWAIPPPDESERPAMGGRAPLIVSSAFALLLAVTLPWVVQLQLVRLETESARQAALAGNWELALAGFERAAQRQPASALHHMSVGLAAHRLGLVDESTRAYEVASDSSPGDARPWGALAALEADRTQAADLLASAAARTKDPQYAYRLASEFEPEIGEAEAVRFMAIAVVMRPDILASLGSDEAAAVAAALPDAIAEAGTLAPRERHESLWDASLLLGTPLAADAPVQWRVVEASRDGDEAGAAELLREARRVDPRAVRTQQAAAMVASMECDRTALEEADHLSGIAARSQQTATDELIDDRAIGLYREPELGDYQPIVGPRIPENEPWPFGLVEVPDCGW